jgi:hypothetical protein
MLPSCGCKPIQLDRRDGSDVQAVDLRGIDQVALPLLVLE